MGWKVKLCATTCKTKMVGLCGFCGLQRPICWPWSDGVSSCPGISVANSITGPCAAQQGGGPGFLRPSLASWGLPRPLWAMPGGLSPLDTRSRTDDQKPTIRLPWRSGCRVRRACGLGGGTIANNLMVPGRSAVVVRPGYQEPTIR